MNDQNPVLHSREQLVQECEVAKLRIAFFDLIEEDIDRLNDSTDNNKIIDDLAIANRSAAFRLVNHTMRTMRFDSFRKSASAIAMRFLKAAVIIIAAMTIATTTVFALAPDFRLVVRNMVIRMTDEYVVIGARGKYTLNVPDAWNGDYYPTIIPNGFELSVVSQPFTDSAFVEYGDSQGNRFAYLELHSGSRTNIDIENAKITKTTVHDTEAMAIVKGDQVTITWSEFDRIFIVMLDGDLNDALPVARSVQRIK